MKRWLTLLFLCLLIPSGFAEEAPKGKYTIVLQAGNETNEGMARAIHALTYATELAENGFDVVLIFDGAGTGWANEFAKPENALHGQYLKIQELGLVEEICEYCAEKFKVREQLSPRQKALLVGDYKGHPSLLKWIGQGYEVIVL